MELPVLPLLQSKHSERFFALREGLSVPEEEIAAVEIEQGIPTEKPLEITWPKGARAILLRLDEGLEACIQLLLQGSLPSEVFVRVELLPRSTLTLLTIADGGESHGEVARLHGSRLVHLCSLAPHHDTAGPRLRSVTHSGVQARTMTCDVSIDQRGIIGAEATLHWFNVATSEGSLRWSLSSEARGQGAKSEVDWLFKAGNKTSHDLSVRNIFSARDGGGEVTVKGIAEDHAHVRCKGFIEIGPKGTGTNTFLTEDVLMLDSTARIDAIPGLEIKTNDVKASHSATVSRVSPEDLFYFASRGIPESEARTMYVEGFLGELVEKLPGGLLRETASSALHF